MEGGHIFLIFFFFLFIPQDGIQSDDVLMIEVQGILCLLDDLKYFSDAYE